MARPTLDRLRKAAEKAANADVNAATLRAQRDALALAVYEAATPEQPVTYNDVAEALGVTRDRVSQVFAAVRKSRPTTT